MPYKYDYTSQFRSSQDPDPGYNIMSTNLSGKIIYPSIQVSPCIVSHSSKVKKEKGDKNI